MAISKAETSQSVPGPPRGSPLAIWSMVLCVYGACIVFSLPIALLLAIGLLPTLASLVIDRKPGCYAVQCVAMLNLAGIAPWAMELLHGHATLAKLSAMLSNVFVWLTMYGAAAGGWAIFFAMPSVAALYLGLVSNQRIAKLEHRREQLLADWGSDASGAGER